MPVTPDDFDRQPPSAPEPPVTPDGIPIYQPPVRVSPAAPAKRGTPGWVTLLVILAILFILFALASNGAQRREVPTTDTAVINTTVTAMSHLHLQRRPAVQATSFHLLTSTFDPEQVRAWTWCSPASSFATAKRS